MEMRYLLVAGGLLAACSSSDSGGLGGEYRGVPGSSSILEGGRFVPVPGDLSACSAAYLHAGGDECSRSERAVTDADMSALGFDARSFLELISGDFRSELTWQAGDVPGARTELVLSVEPRGEARFVERDFENPRPDYTFTISNGGGRYFACGDRLAVDAQVSIVSADGALNEVVDAVVEADSERYAKITITLNREELAGNILAARGPAEGDTSGQPRSEQLTLTFGISSFGLEASVAAHPRYERVELGGQSCTSLGSMFLSSSCAPWGAVPMQPGDEVLGLSFEGALALANAASPATLLDSGAELTLAFDAAPQPVCVSIDTPAALPSVVEFPARVQLASSDGRVGGALDVLLTAEAAGGTLRRVTAGSSYLAPVAEELPELAPSYAILEPLTWSELESGGFELYAEARPDGARGVLRAYGSELGCEGTRPCEEVCPGPGCTATTVEKWGVRWGDPAIGTNGSEAP
jgi:hypothetical protein